MVFILDERLIPNPPTDIYISEEIDTRVGFFGHVILNISWDAPQSKRPQITVNLNYRYTVYTIQASLNLDRKFINLHAVAQLYIGYQIIDSELILKFQFSLKIITDSKARILHVKLARLDFSYIIIQMMLIWTTIPSWSLPLIV